MMDRLSLKYVWQQGQVPVILRRTRKGEKHRVRLPFEEGNRAWLQRIGKSKPVWFGGRNAYWEIPKTWFNDFVNLALERFGKVSIIQPFRQQEKCSPACQNAIGHECQCSCMGEHHGAGNDGSWFEVSDTFSTRRQQRRTRLSLVDGTLT